MSATRKPGRPPLGARAMTPAERTQRHRDKNQGKARPAPPMHLAVRIDPATLPRLQRYLAFGYDEYPDKASIEDVIAAELLRLFVRTRRRRTGSV